MKKKKINFIVVIILILALIPIPMKLKDGGSVEYKAILYEVKKYHTINTESTKGYDDGLKIKILGLTIYDKINTYIETENNDAIIKVIGVGGGGNNYMKIVKIVVKTVYVEIL